MGTLMRNKEGVNGFLPGTCCQKIGNLAWQQAIAVHSLQAQVIGRVLGQILMVVLSSFLSSQEP